MIKKMTIGAAILATASLFAAPALADDHMEEAAVTLPAGTYSEDDGHAYIIATYMHQGYSAPYIRFNDFSVDLDYSEGSLDESSVEVVVQAASVDSGVKDFDDHLKSADFFEVEAYPEITFVSTGMEKTSDMTGTLTGDLTIKDTTKPVTLDVTLNKVGETRNGGTKVGFSAKGTVLRSDFGVDMAVPFVDDEIDLIIEIEMVKDEE